MLSKKWTKWAILFAGSTLAALQLGACVANLVFDKWLQSVIN